MAGIAPCLGAYSLSMDRLSSESSGSSEHYGIKETSYHYFEEADAGSLAGAAARLSGACSAVYFGPESEGAFAAARKAELERLGLEAVRSAPRMPAVFRGGEHDVFVLEDSSVSYVWKATLDGKYGMIMDEKKLLDPATFQNRNKLTMRGALPSEYLRRWALLAEYFYMPTRYEGVILEASLKEPRMVISQPYIEQDDDDQVSVEDIQAFMDAHAFKRVDAKHIAIKELGDVTWYRSSDGILLTDAFPRNFRKDLSGRLFPIDLCVSVIPKERSLILENPGSCVG